MELITLKDNEEFLRQTSQKIVNVDDQLRAQVEEIGKYCRENPVFAMAAVQLGLPKRVIYIKNSTKKASNCFNPEYDEKKIMLNPEIIEAYGETCYWESCQSCAEYTGFVRRPYRMKVKYQDLDLNEHVEEYEGFICTIFCHEIDHLDGIVHMDRAEKVLELSNEERRDLGRKEPYKIISQEGKFTYGPIKKFKR